MKRLLSTIIACLLLQTAALFAQQTYKLTLRTTPQAIAGFYIYTPADWRSVKGSVHQIHAGDRVTVRLDDIYRLLGPWKLTEWRAVEGSANLDVDYKYGDVVFDMPAEDLTLVAVMEYNPDNPDNPMPNGWYPDEGKLIIDNTINAGGKNPIRALLGDQEDYPMVKTVILGGYVDDEENYLDYWLTAEDFPSLRRVDLSRSNGIDYVYDLRNRPWTELLLPASVKRIGNNAFEGTFIEALTVFATTPPEISVNSFPSESDMTVFVPEEALPLYCTADVWKDFTLRPIIENAANVTVSVLPDAPIEDLVPYYGMTLELQNVKSLETRHMLITSRHDYSFRTLPTGTVYNVRLLNRTGGVVAHLENIYLENEDVSVVLNTLRKTCTLQLRVMNGNDIVKSDAYSVVWLDNDGNVIGHAPTVDGVMDDEPVQVLFSLTDAGLKQAFVARDTITISNPAEQAAPHHVSYSLRPIPQRKITTTVLRADGEYMDCHDVRQSIYRVTNEGSSLVSDTIFNSPTLGGAYPYMGLTTATPVTLPDGEYELTVMVDGGALQSGSTRFTLGCDTTITFRLAEVKGSAIRTTWSHCGVAADGSDLSTARRTDKRITEASFIIHDLTNGVELKDFAITAEGVIRLNEHLEAGTQIEVTLGNRGSQLFAPVTLTGTADADGNLSMDFVTYDYGTLVVKFKETECTRVAIKVFGSDGQLVASSGGIKSNRTAFAKLKDDDYTVVLMEDGDIANAMNSLRDIERFLSSTMSYNVDYVNVKSGLTSVAQVPYVPSMGSEVHLYTDSRNTRITPKRYSLAPGSLQTMSAQVDFAPEYKGRVTQLKATFNIPENDDMHFVEGSVILNNDKATYTRQGDQLEVPIVEGRLLRFCVVPTAGGRRTVNGRITFMLDGEEYEQPLPATPFNVEDVKIRVLPETAQEYAPVQGMAVPNSEVTLFVNGSTVGTTTSDATGEWLINCPINNSYNMCVNTVYAQYTGYGGFLVKTPEKHVTFNRYGIRVRKVTMTWHPIHDRYSNFKPSTAVFDYASNTCYPKGYTVVPYPADVFYDIELATSDSTYIDDVILYVETSKDEEYELHAKYSGGNRWYAMNSLPAGEYPVSVGTEIRHHAPKMLGNEGITGRLNYWDDYFTEAHGRKAALQQLGDVLLNADDGSEAEQKAMYQMMKFVGIAQDDYLRAYEQNKDNPGFDPEYPDPANPYFPGYTESYYAEGEAGMKELADDVNEIEQTFSILNDTWNLDGDGWELPAQKGLNELGQIIPGYTVSKVSEATRRYYESRRGKMAPRYDADSEDGVYEYEVTTEKGNGVFIRMDDNGYRLVILDEDIQLDVDFNTIAPNLSANLREVRQLQAEARRLMDMAPAYAGDDSFLSYLNSVMDQLLDAMTKLSNTLGAYQDWMDRSAQMCQQAYRDTKAAGWKMWRKYHDVVRRGFENTVQGKDLLKRCKLGGYDIAKKLDRLADLKKYFEKMRGTKVLGPIFSAFNLYGDYNDLLDALANLTVLYESIPDPCKDDQAAANSIRRSLVGWGTVRIAQKVTAVTADIASLTAAIAGLISAAPTGGTGTLLGGGISLGISVLSWVGNLGFDWAYEGFFDGIRSRLEALKCQKIKKDKHEPKIGPITPLVDPSGFVYEAVASNRVEGATASVYYKETYEDAYGDEHERVTLWDAERYGYVNPQLTDENGEYGWDVPAGQWQVRVTKDGYRPVTSEWLPVPPPQLDVNLELQQPSAPEVQRVVASEQGVQIDFDKYMKLAHLTTDNIFLTQNGQRLPGTVTMLNAEATPDSVSTYASRLLFQPAEKLQAAGKVRLTVKAGIESYANVAMLQDFTQEFDVEQRVEQIVTDEVCTMTLGEERSITVSALPAAVAAGKRVLVAQQNSNVVTTDAEELTLDANGQGTFTLKGNAYGATAVRLGMADDADVTRTIAVSVKDMEGLITQEPEASRISGTEFDSGATVRLSCTTPNAVIYYTLDGTCPCDNPDRLRYTSPITLEETVTLKAMAVSPGYVESDVVTYIYWLRGSQGIQSPTTTTQDMVPNTHTYTLQGVKLEDGKRLQKGVYIRNGEKVVVK